jgi:hypothetical protein
MQVEYRLIWSIALAIVSVAEGADRFPLTEGVVWEYQRFPQNLGRYSVYFSGHVDVEGTTACILRADNGQQSFWSETPDGDKLAHGGAFRLEAPLTYSPPIVKIDEPLYVGKTWEVNTRDSDGLVIHILYEVTAYGDVVVPAGTFEAFTIREALDYPEGGGAQKAQPLLREWRDGPNDTKTQVAYDTYADGIGLIQSSFGSRTDSLLSRRTVAVEATTWTRIRTLYR